MTQGRNKRGQHELGLAAGSRWQVRASVGSVGGLCLGWFLAAGVRSVRQGRVEREAGPGLLAPWVPVGRGCEAALEAGEQKKGGSRGGQRG